MVPLVQHGVLQAQGTDGPQPRAVQRAQRNVVAYAFNASVADIIEAGMQELNKMMRGSRLARLKESGAPPACDLELRMGSLP